MLIHWPVWLDPWLEISSIENTDNTSKANEVVWNWKSIQLLSLVQMYTKQKRQSGCNWCAHRQSSSCLFTVSVPASPDRQHREQFTAAVSGMHKQNPTDISVLLVVSSIWKILSKAFCFIFCSRQIHTGLNIHRTYAGKAHASFWTHSPLVYFSFCCVLSVF